MQRPNEQRKSSWAIKSATALFSPCSSLSARHWRLGEADSGKHSPSFRVLVSTSAISGLHNSFHPTIRDGSCGWSKLGARGES